jgi:hypothetical protein
MNGVTASTDKKNDVVFSSDRLFQVISYYASHGLLLLKSRPNKDSDQFVHLLFQDVRALEIRMWFSGLTVVKQGIDYLDRFASKPGEMLEPDLQVYELRSTDWQGYILGGICRAKEYASDTMYNSQLIGELPPIFLGLQKP